MKIGLFFGSFNPIHSGHTFLANYILNHSDLECIWFVISPHNPFKEESFLLTEYERLKMVNMALIDNENMMASDIEFHLPKPSYTIDTLNVLKEKFKEDEFVLIMGTDNLTTLHKWKNYDTIIKEYNIYAYSRPNIDVNNFQNNPKIKIFNAELMEISSTFIRESIKKNKNLEHILSPQVWNYIKTKGFYQ